MSKYGFFSGPYFSVFGPEKTPYLDIFHTVIVLRQIILPHFYFPHCGYLPGNRQQWKIVQNQNFGYFIQIYKILHSVKQDWSILGWSDPVWGTERQTTQPVRGNCLWLTFPKTNKCCLSFLIILRYRISCW